MTEPSEIGALVLAVVRGDLSVDAVTRIGIDIDYENGSYKLKSGNFDVAVRPTASDVALGILRYSSGNRNDVRKWAFFVLSESGAIDFSALESHPQGDLLISALWDASFEGRIPSEVVAAAEAIKRGSGAD